jgi:hypothetical protein
MLNRAAMSSAFTAALRWRGKRSREKSQNRRMIYDFEQSIDFNLGAIL